MSQGANERGPQDPFTAPKYKLHGTPSARYNPPPPGAHAGSRRTAPDMGMWAERGPLCHSFIPLQTVAHTDPKPREVEE